MTTTEQLAKAQAELAASREYTRQLYIQVADLQAGLVREDKFPTITGEHWKESLERAKATANGISEQIKSTRPEAAPASPAQIATPRTDAAEQCNEPESVYRRYKRLAIVARTLERELSALEQAVAPLRAECVELRTMLYVYSSGMKGYHDDGELQDTTAQPCIDWKRDTVAEIKEKNLKRSLAAIAVPAQQSAKVEALEAEVADATGEAEDLLKENDALRARLAQQTDALRLAVGALEAVEIYESYNGESERRDWAESASMWLYPDQAVAKVDETKLNEALAALRALTKEGDAK